MESQNVVEAVAELGSACYRERDALRAENERLRAALLACARNGAWQPIETAPKDGSWLLLAGGDCHDDEGDKDGRPVTAQWTNYLNGRIAPNCGRWQFAWYDGGFYGVYYAPTHWMPLPAPPQ